MFSTNSDYSSIQELLGTDAESPLDDSTLDDQLWLLLCDRIKTPEDLAGMPSEVGYYYASRLVQWEVGNGGFAQAAYNAGDLFSLAAEAYEAFGKREFAALIREAEALNPEDPDDIEQFEDQFESLDDRLDDLEWEIDEERIAFVREHRSAFLSGQSEISPSALQGRWSASKKHPSGALLTTVVQLSQDKSFTTSTTVNGTPFMEASGTWRISDKQLEWTYERSSQPAIQKGLVDIDDIKSVSAAEMVLSSRTGLTHIYKKVP